MNVYYEDFGYGVAATVCGDNAYDLKYPVAVLFEDGQIVRFTRDDNSVLLIHTTKRVCFIEARFFRSRKKELADQGIKLEVFHVLRKARFKSFVRYKDVVCKILETQVKENYTYYKIARSEISIGWYYEQDLEPLADIHDPLGR